ncbi:hypothetical protein GDO86_014237, partial [Hymenochirus boettgeri]
SSGSLKGLGSDSSCYIRSSGSCRVPGIHGSFGGRSFGKSHGYGGHGSSSAWCLNVGYGGHSGFSHGGHSGFGHGGHSGFHHGGHSFLNDGIHKISEKETMHQLNDRLANYLGKVHSLEKENNQFERNIREWYDNQVPYTSPDFHHYFKSIEELHNKIHHACTGNAEILLKTDNARLAADDFRNKYENEASLCMGAEGEINGLRRVLDELNMNKNDLEIQLQSLNEELDSCKKNHAEEVSGLRSQLGSRVHVEVDAAPARDLTKILSEIREQYENIVEKNRKEAEDWFMNKSDELNQQVTSSAEQLETVHTEVIQLRNTVQSLEIDLQSQSSMKAALECTLTDTEARYSGHLSQLQCLINNVETKLADLRSELERQNYEYKALMDVKTRLEMEIGTYRHLIDGEDLQ